MEDRELLNNYVRSGSHSAFAELVARHTDMVYATSLRFVRNAHLAEDVTQAVFLVLARKARSVAGRPALAGWLYTVARYAAANALTEEMRRRRREAKAAAMRGDIEEPSMPEDPRMLALDEALGSLGGRDRDVLVLRFFEDMTVDQIGTTLGINKDAAAKRVTRALGRLRRRMAAAGGTAAMSLGLSASKGAAPIGLSARAIDSALSGTTLPATVSQLVARTVAVMNRMRLLAAMKVAAVLVAGVGIAVPVVREARGQIAAAVSGKPAVAEIAPPALPAASLSSSEALEVALDDGAVARLLALCSPAKPSLGWWSPGGRAMQPEPRVQQLFSAGKADLLAVVEVRRPGMPQADAGPAGEKTSDAVQLAALTVARNPNGDLRQFTVGFGIGPWQTVGRLAQGKALESGEMSVLISDIQTEGGISRIRGRCNTIPELEWAIVAVDAAGHETTFPGREGAVTSRPVADIRRTWTNDANPPRTVHSQTYRIDRREPAQSFTLDAVVPVGPIDHVVLKTRRRVWASFYGFADQPKEKLSFVNRFGRIWDPQLDGQVHAFLDRLKTGDPAAGEFLAAEMDGQCLRAIEWHAGADVAAGAAREFQQLRHDLTGGLSDAQKRFYSRVEISADMHLEAPRVGDRAVISLLQTENGTTWRRTLLLKNDQGWRVAGIIPDHDLALMAAMDFLRNSPGANPAFGRTIEVKISTAEAKEGRYVDLDAGSMQAAPAGGATPQWVTAQGIDIKVPSQSGGVESCDLATLGINFEYYHLSPEELRAKAVSLRPDSGGAFSGGPFVFRTHAGAIGVLQALTASDGSVMIRYKMLQDPARPR